jgi:hypothetical protein
MRASPPNTILAKQENSNLPGLSNIKTIRCRSWDEEESDIEVGEMRVMMIVMGDVRIPLIGCSRR